MLAGLEVHQPFADLLAIDAENIQRSLNIARQGGVFVEFTNSVDDLLRARGAAGVELQQPVAARGER